MSGVNGPAPLGRPRHVAEDDAHAAGTAQRSKGCCSCRLSQLVFLPSASCHSMALACERAGMQGVFSHPLRFNDTAMPV